MTPMTSDLSHHRRTARNIAVLFVGVIIGLLLTIGLGGRSASAQSGPPGDPGCVYSGGGWICYGTFPPGQGPAEDRLGGADRYETAAAIATYQQDPSENVVILASSTLVDATTAGTHLDGPTLLVPHGSDNVPQATLDAAVALNPDRVIVLGGTGAVSEAQAHSVRYAIYANG